MFYKITYRNTPVNMKQILFLCTGIVLISCSERTADSQRNTQEQHIQEDDKAILNEKAVCNDSSIWRDNNGIDSCSYYKSSAACKKIIGKLQVISKLHKGALTPGVFEGGMSSNWYEIKKDSMIYYKSSGEIDDRGSCNCHDGKLTVEWKKNYKTIEYEIHFNSKNQVELRYLDYPFNFQTLSYDFKKPKVNPTKILGIIK